MKKIKKRFKLKWMRGWSIALSFLLVASLLPMPGLFESQRAYAAPGTVTEAVYPGGVKGVALWLKASDNVEVASSSVTSWTDVNGIRFTIDTVSNGVTLDDSLANFNPTLKFGGNGRMDGGADSNMSVREIFTIAKFNNNQQGTIFSVKNTISNLQGFFRNHDNGPLVQFPDTANNVGTAREIYSPDLRENDGMKLLSASAGEATAWENGVAGDSKTPLVDVGSYELKLGATDRNTLFLNGHFPELIVFDEQKELTPYDRDRINSYLALKYGVTLKSGTKANSSTANYVDSNGTPFWTAAGDNAAYGYRITGLGRDDASGLAQKQSKSVDVNANVTIAMGDTIQPTNLDNKTSFGNNTSFFVFGDNNGSTDFTNPVSAAGAPADLTRMSREYKVEKTNWADADVTFALDNVEPDNYYYLLINGRFDPALLVSSEGKVTLSSAKLNNGDTFTFARTAEAPMQKAAPGGVSDGLISWVDVEDSMNSSDGTKIESLTDLVDLDPDVEGDNVWTSSDKATPNTFIPNAINFNGGLFITSGRGYYIRTHFNTSDTAREVFSIQGPAEGLPMDKFPWHFGGDGASDTFRPNLIQSSLGNTSSESALSVNNSNGSIYSLGEADILNVLRTKDIFAISLNAQKLAEKVPAENANYNPGKGGGSTAGGYYFGAGHNRRFDGMLSETLLYNKSLETYERNKVYSYLALKYGITLTGNYVASDWNGTKGTTFWNAVDNAGYNNRIAGIGYDPLGAQTQKQSKSQGNGANVTIALGDSVAETNAANQTLFHNEKSFFVFGDNGKEVSFEQGYKLANAESVAIRTLERVYKVQKTNWDNADRITLQVDKIDQEKGYPGYLIVSSSQTFDSGVTYFEVDPTDGLVTLSGSDIGNGYYFTFGSAYPLPDSAKLELAESNAVTGELQLTFDRAVALDNLNGFEIKVGDKTLVLTGLTYKVDENDKTKLIIALPEEELASGKAITIGYDGTGTLRDLASGVSAEAFKETLNAVNKAALKQKIAEALDISDEGYLEAAWRTFEAALDAAESVLADDGANQSDVDTVLESLQAAIDGLEKYPPVAVEGDFVEGTNTITITFDKAVDFDLGGGGVTDGFTVKVGGTEVTVIDAAVDRTDPTKLILTLEDTELSVEQAVQVSYDATAGRLVGAGEGGAKVGDFELDAEDPFASGLRILKPGGDTSDKTPAIQGNVPATADSLTVILKDDQGSPVDIDGELNWSTGGTTWSYELRKELPPGTYTVEVTAKEGSRTVTKARTFTITATVDKTALQAEVDRSGELNAVDYTPESWNLFQLKLGNALTVLKKSDATQGEVDDARRELAEARDMLVPVGDDPLVTEVALDETNRARVIVKFDQSVKLTSDQLRGFGLSGARDPITVTQDVYELSADGTQLTLYLNREVEPGEEITLTYDEALGNLVAAETDRKLQSFSRTIALESRGLQSLVPSAGTLTPVFNPQLTEGYRISVSNGTASIRLTPTSVDPNATITIRVNGGEPIPVPSGSASGDLPLAVGANGVEVVVTDSNGQITTYRMTVTRADASNGGSGGGSGNSGSGSSDTPTAPSGPVTTTIEVDVVIGGDEEADITKVPIERTKNRDGSISDRVIFTKDKAQETVDKALKSGKDLARILIPDEADEVSQVNLEIPAETVNLLKGNGIALEIYNPNVFIQVPADSLDGLNQSFYFRLVPVKDKNEREEIELRAKTEEVVRKWAADDNIKVVARPMTIETNLPSRPVTLTLPLRGVTLPDKASERAAFLAQLGIFIEHTNGEKEVVPGKPVIMPDGQLGLQFSIEHFSTFTIIDFNRQVSAGQHAPYVLGFPDGQFKPLEKVTRAQLAAMIARNLGYAEGTWSGNAPFKDVPAESWSAGVIAFVQEQGIMQGMPDGSFKPNQAVTRAEIATVMANYRKLVAAQGGADGFTDIAAHWAQGNINAAYAAGLLEGFGDGSFKPNAAASRAEAVAMMNRMFERGPLYGVDKPSFPDVPESHWAFRHIEEAATNHSYIIDEEQQEVIAGS